MPDTLIDSSAASAAAPAGNEQISPRGAPRSAWYVAFLFVTTVLLYSRVFSAHFVGWDDDLHVYINPYLRPPTLSSISTFWVRPYQGLYVPLAYMFFAVIAHFAQITPTFDTHVGFLITDSAIYFHAVNIFLHATNTVLVFLLLRRMVRKEPAALAGALLFAIHPLQVESVAWISELRGQTSSLFSLLALLTFMSYRSTQAGSGRRARLGLILTLTVLAGLCKPTAVVLPLAALAMDRIYLKTDWRTSLAVIVPWVIVSIPFALITRSAQPLARDAVTPIWERPFIAGDALAFYLGKLIAPVGLIIHYGRTPTALFTHPWAYATWLVPAAVMAAAYRYRRTRPNIWLGALLFVIFLLPELGLVPFEFQHISTVADRYAYLSMIGVGLIAGELLSRLSIRTAAVAAGLPAAALAALTWIQTGYWHDTRHLMDHCLAVNPGSAIAYTNRGTLEMGDKQYISAAADFQRAIARTSDNELALVNLGNVYSDTGEWGLAKQILLRATSKNSSNADAQSDLGVALSTMNDNVGAERAFRRSADLAPNSPTAIYNYGLFLEKIKRYNDAIVCYRRVIELAPSLPMAHMALAIALFRTGHVNEAITEFQQTLRLSPHEPGAQQDLESALQTSQKSLHL